MEKLEISLNTELVKRMDEVVELLDFGSREELIRCTIRRYIDQYYTMPKSTKMPI